MGIKLTTLLKIFPRRTSISSILGVSRQAVSIVHEFNDPGTVALLHRASKKRLAEINRAFNEIETEAEKVKRSARERNTYRTPNTRKS